MKAGWEIKAIGDVCDVVNGGTPKTGTAAYWDGPHQWITPAEMGKRISPYVDRTQRTITDDGLKNSSARLLPPHSVILSSRAPIGHLVINTELMATNQGCKGLIPGSIIDHKFLFYYLTSIVDLLNDLGSGATFKELSGGKLKEVPVPVAPLPEQQCIVGILDEAFDSIATVKANAEKNLQNACALFESHLSSINAEKVSLGDLVKITTGKLDANAAVEDGQYSFFTCSRDIYAIDNFAFDCEAILLAGNNAVGDFNVKHYKGKFNAYQRTYVITVNGHKRVLYRFLYFQMLKSLKKFKEQSVGAGTKFLKLGMIKDMEIALPSIAEQEQIVLDGLAEKGFGKEQLAEMQKICNAEKSDLFDVLAYVAYALAPLTRKERANKAKIIISTHFNSRQQVFLAFVLSHYVSIGVEELDQAKLTPLLRLKYHDSITDAVADLGQPEEIGHAFTGFQQYLYQQQVVA